MRVAALAKIARVSVEEVENLPTSEDALLRSAAQPNLPVPLYVTTKPDWQVERPEP